VRSFHVQGPILHPFEKSGLILAQETLLSLEQTSGLMGGRIWTGANAPTSPALVFCHANGFCASTYRQILSRVADETGSTIIGLDLRGHGRTQLPADPDRMDNWTIHARDILAALEVVAPQGCVLAGHSMGATSCLLAAALDRTRVKRLVMFDPVLAPRAFYIYAHMPWTFGFWRKHFPLAKAAGCRRAVFGSRQDVIAAYRGRGAFKSWTPGMLEDYCDDGLKDRADGQVELSCHPAFEASGFAGQRHDPLQALSRLQLTGGIGGVLMRGARFSTASPLVMGKVRAAGLEVETIADTSHFLPMERPDLAVARLVSELRLQA
jgi:pimeloyl-ACP methyl ester carboxylesterase